MSLPATPVRLSEASQTGVVQFYKSAAAAYATNYNIRSQLEMRDRAYYREEDTTTEEYRAKWANQTGDSKKLRNLTIPVAMPQTESALAYLTEIFLTGYPVFATYAPPQYQAELTMFDTVLADNSIRFKWVPELMKVMRDGLKYDLGAAEVSWERQRMFNIETAQLKDISKGEPLQVNYEGNRIKRLDPYNLLLDYRVSPDENHREGEFGGYSELLSRIATKKRFENLDKKFTMNFTKAMESGTPVISANAADAGYYIPTINPDALLPGGGRMEHDWLKWSGMIVNSSQKIAYHNSYMWTTLYARIMPVDFNIQVPNASNVQIWKFIFINEQICVYAERLTNAHDLLPIVVCRPSNDGMGYQSKSFVENVMPIQNVATSLMNSAIASQRRKVYDRMLYDPTRVRKQDIDVVSEVARIPVKNAQFGKGMEGAVQVLPYNDTGVAEVIQMSQQVVAMGDVMNGSNRVQQGQFQKGNKTRREFDVTMGAASSRQKLSSLSLEGTFFSDVKEMIKINMLQYQQPANILDPKSNTAVAIDPMKLRASILGFTLTDGMTSSEKVGSLDVTGTFLQAAAATPSLQVDYDIGGIMERYFDLQGLHWIKDYKRDDAAKQQYLAQMTQQTAAGSPPKPGSPPAPPDAGAKGAI